MARYIDADSLYRRVKTHTNPYGKPTLDYKSGVQVLDMINQEPTADVAPKSEVEQLKRNLEQCENGYRQEMHLLQCKLKNAKSEVDELQTKIAELKKDRYYISPDGGIELLPRSDIDKIKIEVARKIFEEIEKFCRPPMPECKPIYVIRDSEMEELKSKYLEDM